jgi:RecA-family ATPase
MEDNAESTNADQSNFVQQCKDFAEAYRVHVMLVVHPSKLKRRGEALEKEDISGSNNIPNKADVIISVERQYKEDRDCDAKLRLLKDREEGQYKEVNLIFQEGTKRLLEYENGAIKNIQYSWRQFLPLKEEKEWWENEPEESPF